jgi:hypothetical protein
MTSNEHYQFVGLLLHHSANESENSAAERRVVSIRPTGESIAPRRDLHWRCWRRPTIHPLQAILRLAT